MSDCQHDNIVSTRLIISGKIIPGFHCLDCKVEKPDREMIIKAYSLGNNYTEVITERLIIEAKSQGAA